MAEEIIYTQESYDKKQQELEYLKTIKMAENARKIEIARGYGDLSENAEYTEAKEEQSQLLAAIEDLEKRLKNARIVSDADVTDKTIVGIGSKVTCEEIEDGEIVDVSTYTIAADGDDDVSQLRISYLAPIGAGLMGKKEGETVNIEIPDGIIVMHIIKVER